MNIDYEKLGEVLDKFVLNWPHGGTHDDHMVCCETAAKQVLESSGLLKRVEELEEALIKQQFEISQTLGKDLGYKPMEGDPGGCVCTGEHTAESLAMEAAQRIATLEATLNDARGYASRLFKAAAPECEPLDTLMGVLTQLDNLIAGQQATLKRLEDAYEELKNDAESDAFIDGAINACDVLERFRAALKGEG